MAKTSTTIAPPDFGIDPEELPRLVKPDPVRPGRSRWRLVEADLPIWPLIWWINGSDEDGDATDAAKATEAQIAQLADYYMIAERDVRIALAYYVRNRGYIDALIDENIAATS